MRVIQGGLWHLPRAEKIEDHEYKNSVFPNRKNKKVRSTFLASCSYTRNCV